MRVVAIVQARMSSTRLPGKSLRLLAGMPLLDHVIQRLGRCETLDEAVIATSVDSSDDPIERFGRERGIRVVRGPLEDVLARFVIAADTTSADVIVRVTGDAPLVDPPTIDSMVRALIDQRAEYCELDPEHPTIHEGFEPFTRTALMRVSEQFAADLPSQEHVTVRMKDGSAGLRVARIPSDPRVRFDGARVSVDTEADLVFLEAVYDRLGVPPGMADIRDVVSLLREHPSLLMLNAHVRQKPAEENTELALIRCDGGASIGLGHVVRCLAVASALIEHHSFGVMFAMSDRTEGSDLVREAGLPVDICPPGVSEPEWIDGLLREHRSRCLILDIRTKLTPERLRVWRDSGVLVALIDDATDRRFAADVSFYPPVPQVNGLEWDDDAAVHRIGWDWVALRPSFAKVRPGAHEGVRILVAMGGADPAGMTAAAVEALRFVDAEVPVTVLLGHAFRNAERIRDALAKQARESEVLSSVADPATVMARCDMAVCTFGMTAYELAAVGIPAIHICLDEDHAASSSAFVDAGIAASSHLAGGIAPERLGREIRELAHDAARRSAIAARARQLVDGRGASRIAGEIARMTRSRDA